MEKSDKKGFILAETIAVCAVVLGALIFIYTQFISINNSYYTSFKYNTVDDLYKVDNIVKFLEEDGIQELIKALNASKHHYVDITACQNGIIESSYCEMLLRQSNVKQAIFTSEDPTSLKNSFKDSSSLSEGMKSFIKKINTSSSSRYRLIVEFENGNFATLKFDKQFALRNCTYDGEMVRGAEFVNGQYTYRYLQEYGDIDYGDGNFWSNIDRGWSVVLTDKTSTEPVTTPLCATINNEPITSMMRMFSESQAASIDLSSFNTSNVTNMNKMFTSSVTTNLDFSSFNTSNVTNMSYMFALTSHDKLDLSSFDTSNVTSMYWMFHQCKALDLNISSFNTSNVITMRQMFEGGQFEKLDLRHFDTGKVRDMFGMFQQTAALELDVSNFNTSNVENMSMMFNQCIYPQTIDVSGFDTSNVTDMSYMFYYVRSPLDVSSFNTSKVTNMAKMFYGTKNVSLDLRNFDTSKVTSMREMFGYTPDTTSINVSSFNTANVTDMEGMFTYCGAGTLDLTHFNTEKVKDMSVMFYMCSADPLDLSSFDMTGVLATENMFGNVQTTVGYAKTQADADKLNATSGKPAGLTFTVK